MGSDAARLLDAADFAAQKHREQRRKDPEGTPFINHPLAVARILACEAGVTDIELLQAALLHDTVEDTDTTFSELEARFGGAVTGLVREVTDDKELPRAERKRLQVERAPDRSPRARLLMLADKLHNLRDITRCPPAGTGAPGPLFPGRYGSTGAAVPRQVREHRGRCGRGCSAACRDREAPSTAGGGVGRTDRDRSRAR
uniref:Guanosine-3',5'-bis(diphosphate) 3'-pyrophosphohydrolase MESH1 n=1 Tax=Melopsittacus undulatus TaxID=13146 RepID=A0A8V5HED6_MELUD